MSDEDAIEIKLKDLEEKILADPYNAAVHKEASQLVKLLPPNHSGREKIYYLKGEYFTFTKSDIDDFFQYTNSIDSLSEDALMISGMIANHFPTGENWAKYLRLIKGSENYGSYLTEAWEDCQFDYYHSNEVFDIMVENLESNNPNWRDLHTLFDDRLKVPHHQIDETFNKFCSLCSKYAPQQYDLWVPSRSELYHKTKRLQAYYEKFEIPLKKNPNNVSMWLEYMENLFQYDDDNFETVVSIFVRAVEMYDSDEWLPLWKCATRMVRSLIKDALAEYISASYIRRYPYHPDAYAEYLTRTWWEDEEYDDLMKRIESNKVLDPSNDPYLIVGEAIILMKYRYHLYERSQESAEELYEEISKYLSESYNRPNDGKYRIPRLALSIYDEMKEEDKAIDLIENLTTQYSSYGNAWLLAIDYMKSKLPPEGLKNMFEEAVDALDGHDPDNKLQEIRHKWISFHEIAGDIEKNRKVVWKCYLSERKEQKYLETEQDKMEIEPEASPIPTAANNSQAKRMHDDVVESDQQHRSREEFTVKISNINQNTTVDDLRVMFEECGDIRDISIHSENGQYEGLIEFSGQQEVLSALTKTYKQLGDSQIVVTKFENATLFVNNYPSTYSQAQVREMFEKIGPIVGVRFPNQHAGHRIKRFCYVQYVTSEDAKKAIFTYNGKELYDENLKKAIPLEVVVSRPQEKKKRSTPISERKIRVSNLPFNLGEDEIREIFGDCGKIDQVTFPRLGKSKNNKNDGIAIIVFESEQNLDKAVKLHETEIQGRKINVQKQHAKHHTLTPRGFDDLKTIGLSRVDTTLNQNDIREYFTQKFGPVEKVLLMPDQEKILVEFQFAADAGRATMSQPAIKLGDSFAQIQSKSECLKSTSVIEGNSTKAPNKLSMVPPNLIKRRRR
ncbi:uncharacterized protein J8A68_001580 [[Candida] subhashii]|uniref:RRM domain-containing protein n=1 Tax=[Candida] subhashii TaxID=561895 RepID=A0A8J5QKS6_9ASCO|nr:uncharacterized protein J8A68_001580 [[Candida] subhashii]KAG7664887.1 hypothetical protein J8A68_001580 [[Candida] subhashii]